MREALKQAAEIVARVRDAGIDILIDTSDVRGRLLARATLRFGNGHSILSGFELRGFEIVAGKTIGMPYSVTWPAKSYSVNGIDHSYHVLRIWRAPGDAVKLTEAIAAAFTIQTAATVHEKLYGRKAR
jgi:hypothetical protein